jgi:uncharacterized membrane protein
MDKTLYRISLIAAVIGLLVSIYMTIYKITDNNTMCLGNGGCSAINTSKYSVVYGIPVAAIGIVGYLAIVVTHLLENRSDFFEDNATLLVFGMSLTGFLFATYLTYLEFFIIKAVCPFCVTSQIAITAVFIVSIIRLVREPAN